MPPDSGYDYGYDDAVELDKLHASASYFADVVVGVISGALIDHRLPALGAALVAGTALACCCVLACLMGMRRTGAQKLLPVRTSSLESLPLSSRSSSPPLPVRGFLGRRDSSHEIGATHRKGLLEEGSAMAEEPDSARQSRGAGRRKSPLGLKRQCSPSARGPIGTPPSPGSAAAGLQARPPPSPVTAAWMSHVDVSPARQQSSRGGCPADPVCPPTARRYAALDEEILSEEEGGADEEKYELQDHYASDELPPLAEVEADLRPIASIGAELDKLVHDTSEYARYRLSAHSPPIPSESEDQYVDIS